MTRLALIPPIPHLRTFNTTGVSMLLAHLFSWGEYIEFYRERGEIGEYLILDNGAYEKNTSVVSMQMLLSMASLVRASEVVAPDTIMDDTLTFAKTLEAVDFMSSTVGQLGWNICGRPRIMIVPQVNPAFQEIDHYDLLARKMLDIWLCGAPYLRDHITLGVAKNFAKLHGGWLMLFRECIGSLVKEYPIEVHCLGLPKSISTLKRLLKENQFIRSLDTALPFVSAIHGIDLRTVTDEEIPKRPSAYLENEMKDEAVALAHQNIDFMLEVIG